MQYLFFDPAAVSPLSNSVPLLQFAKVAAKTKIFIFSFKKCKHTPRATFKTSVIEKQTHFAKIFLSVT